MIKNEKPQKRLEDFRIQIQRKKINLSAILKKCPYCGNEDFVKDGQRKRKYKGKIQIYLCNKCHRKFTMDPFPRTHYPPWVYAKILRQSAEGTRPKAIVDDIVSEAKEKGLDMHISSAAVLYIFRDLVDLLIKIEEEYHHQILANEWQIDDCFQKLPHRQWAYITNVMAVDTRYWLASSVSIKRDTQGSEDALEQSVRRAGYFPVEIRCDGLRAHAAAINKVLPHINNIHIKKKKNIAIVNYTERLNKTMRRSITKGKCFTTEVLLQAYTDLIRLQYNFLEKHASLGKKTPVEAAGMQISVSSWQDMVMLTIQYKKRSKHARRLTLRQFAQSILSI